MKSVLETLKVQDKLVPKVSVIIPTFNRVNLLCRAIDSVIAQTFQDFEIIVVDDGSTDGTKDVLSVYNGKIKYIFQENKGVSAARNRGFRESKGEYVVFFDADDIADKMWLHWLIASLEAGSAQVAHGRLIYAPAITLIQKILAEEMKDHAEPKDGEIIKYFSGTNIAFLRISFEKLGGFDESLRYGEDTDLFVRCNQAGTKIVAAQKAIVFYRQREKLLPLLRQKFNYGMSKIVCYRKHKSYRRSFFYDLQWFIADLFQLHVRCLGRLVKGVFIRECRRMEYLLQHFVTIACNMSKFLGKLKMRTQLKMWR